MRSEIDGCVASQHALDEHLGSLTVLDPSAPSALAGWTVGHVLSHLARNADSHVAMLEGRPQYRDSAARDADIEAGARRSIDELITDVRESSLALESAWHEALCVADVDLRWSQTALGLSGPRPLVTLPLLRWREVEIHRMDLDVGYRSVDLDRHYLRCDLRLCEMLWRARRPIGLTPLPQPVLAMPPADRLLWFLGRLEVDGVGWVDEVNGLQAP